MKYFRFGFRFNTMHHHYNLVLVVLSTLCQVYSFVHSVNSANHYNNFTPNYQTGFGIDVKSLNL